jgi:hypothetical protein
MKEVRIRSHLLSAGRHGCCCISKQTPFVLAMPRQRIMLLRMPLM